MIDERIDGSVWLIDGRAWADRKEFFRSMTAEGPSELAGEIDLFAGNSSPLRYNTMRADNVHDLAKIRARAATAQIHRDDLPASFDL